MITDPSAVPSYVFGPVTATGLTMDTVFERVTGPGRVSFVRPIEAVATLDGQIVELILPDQSRVNLTATVWPVSGWHPKGWVLNRRDMWSPITSPSRFPPMQKGEDAKAYRTRVEAVYAPVLPGLSKITEAEWKDIHKAKAEQFAEREAQVAREVAAAEAATAAAAKQRAEGISTRVHRM